MQRSPLLNQQSVMGAFLTCLLLVSPQPHLTPCNSKIMAPEDMHILISVTYGYVTSHGKRDCADVIQLRWGDDPGLSCGSNVIAVVLVSERADRRARCGQKWSHVTVESINE